MKLSLVFPMFWGREKKKVYEEDDFFYDHPTAVDDDGTLPPLFKSMEILKDKDFDIIVVAGANADSYQQKVETAVKNLINRQKRDFSVCVFSYSELKKLHEFLKRHNKGHLIDTIQLKGYSPLRNACFVVANILNSDIAVSIDDDIAFTDENHITTIKNTMKTVMLNEEVLALCGPYLCERDTILLPIKETATSVFYNNLEVMNAAFRKYIIEGDRYKKVPFSIMGNIAVDRDFYTKIPLDPVLSRGEDSDWVMNANIFGYNFIMDNQLIVKHLPAARPYPAWRPLREDIRRYLYIHKKIEKSFESSKTRRINPDDYKPFPGEFFDPNIFMDKVGKACMAMAIEYLSVGEKENAKQALHNIYLAKFGETIEDPFIAYLDFQAKWEEMMIFLSDNRDEIKYLLW